jgi:Raf kinase inhibitor-like YbhB/YbcL family protein
VFIAASVAVVALAAGCDTGDGKQLRPYDPADYPPPATTTVVADTALLNEFEGLDAAVGSVPDVSTPGAVEAFTLTAPWVDGATIDPANTCDGADLSPALSWGGVPEGTVEIAVAMVDDSAVSDGQPFVHWAIAGLDPDEIALAEGDVPDGAVQALNYFGDIGYGGPCPLPGDTAHLYRLTAYALNTSLQLADGTLANEFLEAIAKATIRSTDLTGTYQR